MERNVDNTWWAGMGATVGVMATSQLSYQVITAVISAVAAYVAVYFAKMLLQRYCPIKKNGE